ncbi:MAG: Glu-tRNA(Gln) amidotransferase subunit GatD [Candidatus Diapherotrites archaeon]|uniref:Glutamyl-tRNA(Gln) amidotransferase subunit D n=1 Tax=Candidatus Iainarchaeum sp. TaxID=3101447 RepID=A0A8T4C7E2_9ARCH|nr:Glu-tRNA(Gln) amidotransferase subunit GatD [Candidatus Diapherotrites archaeon]
MTAALAGFFEKYSLHVGERIRVHWKNMPVEGVIIPQPSQGDILKIKLASGYNTGLDINHISSVEKIPSLKSNHSEKIVEHTLPSSAHVTNRPGFSLIGVGGTIASKVNYETGGVIAQITPDELSEMVPQIKEFAQIKQVVTPFTKMSEDNVPADWIRIAHACYDELIKPDVNGVVVSHGTDTLHYTASALSFMLRNLNKPVVLVGSQRSSDRGSSDSVMNLICSARVAISDIAEVGTCMHATTSDDYCFFSRGTSVRKMHSTRRDAFRSINQLPLLKVWPDGKMEKVSEYHPRSQEKLSLDAVFEENIALIKVFPNMKADVLEYYMSKGCKGFVMEATGLGHVHTTNIIPAIQHATQKGIPVFITSQTIYGRVDLNVYTNLRLLQNAGAIGLEDMLAETAYVKLGWVLAHTKEREKVKEMMLTNYAGEITPFSRTDVFLN